MAKLPEPEWLALTAAHGCALRAFPDDGPEEVAAALLSALTDSKVTVKARSQEYYEHSTLVEVDPWTWAAGAVAMQWDAGRFVIAQARTDFIFTDVVVRRVELEKWLRPSADFGEATAGIGEERTRNKPGPRPEKRIKIADQMVADYTDNPQALRREKQEGLVNKYHVSRDTLEKARNIALRQLRVTPTQPQQNPDITPIIDK